METKASSNDEQDETNEEEGEPKWVLTRERYHPKEFIPDGEHDVYTNARPGAYRIGGNDSENPNGNAPRAIVTGLNENSNQQGASSDQIIDGEIVPSRRRLFLYLEVAGFLTLSFGIFAVFLYSSRSRGNKQSQFPSISPSPTIESNYRRNEVMKLLIPLSGEDTLKTPLSPQNIGWEYVSIRDPLYIPLSEPVRIIQRYATIVVAVSILSQPVQKYLGLNSVSHSNECELVPCNERGEITIYELSSYSSFNAFGIIPKEVGLLSGVTHLILSDNGSHGTIPTEVGLLKDLEILDLRKNALTGTIPTEIGLLKNLTWLFLNDNQLINTLPTQIQHLTKLVHIDVSNNDLSGSIPTEFFKLDNLRRFSIHGNKIVGDADFLCDKKFVTNRYQPDDNIPVDPKYDSVGLEFLVDCDDTNMSILICTCCDCI